MTLWVYAVLALADYRAYEEVEPLPLDGSQRLADPSHVKEKNQCEL